LKKVSLLFLIIVFSGVVKTQDFIPIPADTTSYWNVDGYFLVGGECIFNYSYWYYINGEETINGKNYYKLYSKGQWYEEPIWPEDTSCTMEGEHLDFYEGAIRTENNIVYFKPYDNDHEQLLFDYGLKEGDTLPDTIFLDQGNYHNLIITSVDSVVMKSGEYRTRWNIEAADQGLGVDYWFIEGIGTNKGLIQELVPFEWDSELICYSENFEPVYPLEYNCDPTIGISENIVISPEARIYPNPADKLINIRIRNPQSNKYGIDIANLTG
jgi:hypothetical protein